MSKKETEEEKDNSLPARLAQAAYTAVGGGGFTGNVKWGWIRKDSRKTAERMETLDKLNDFRAQNGLGPISPDAWLEYQQSIHDELKTPGTAAILSPERRKKEMNNRGWDSAMQRQEMVDEWYGGNGSSGAPSTYRNGRDYSKYTCAGMCGCYACEKECIYYCNKRGPACSYNPQCECPIL